MTHQNLQDLESNYLLKDGIIAIEDDDLPLHISLVGQARDTEEEE